MDLPEYEDRYVLVEGKKIRYWVEGEGPHLILVHGLACSAEFWQYNVRSLSRQFRVLAPDLPGFGLSDKQIEDLSLPYSARFLVQLMDAMGIERASLVGNSMGGVVCAQAAVLYPQRLNRLVLVGSAGFGRELNFFLRLWSVPVVGDLVFRVYQWAFPALKRWVFSASGSIHGEWLRRAAAVMRTPGVRENTLKVARMGLDLRGQRVELVEDLHQRLAGVTAGTLIVWGSHDAAVPVSHAYVAQKLIPNSQVRILDGCGHIPQVERPEEFNQLAVDFLSA